MEPSVLEQTLGELSRSETWFSSELPHTLERTLRALTIDRSVLVKAVHASAQSDYLRSHCEIDKDAAKIVLWRDPESGASLRLHHFLGAGPERPHTHRWPFATLLLAGKYQHSIFLEKPAKEGHARQGLDRTYVTHHLPGDFYWMGPSAIHAVDAASGTISLFLRGPSISNRTLVFDETRGDVYFHYGSSDDNSHSNRYTRKLEGSELKEHQNAILGTIAGSGV